MVKGLNLAELIVSRERSRKYLRKPEKNYATPDHNPDHASAPNSAPPLRNVPLEVSKGSGLATTRLGC